MATKDVMMAWKTGHGRYGGYLSTNGKELYSHLRKIGYTKKGLKIVIDYTKDGGCFISISVSRHVNLAKKYADKIISPGKKMLNKRRPKWMKKN